MRKIGIGLDKVRIQRAVQRKNSRTKSEKPKGLLYQFIKKQKTGIKDVENERFQNLR